jgi:hypothetical protein
MFEKFMAATLFIMALSASSVLFALAFEIIMRVFQ